MQIPQKDKIILGIDPGTRLMWHSVIKSDGQHFECLEMDVLDMRKEQDPLSRLDLILEEVLRIIDTYQAQYLSIESPFYGKNVQALLKLGRAQGVAIAASISKGLKVHEYSPREIKQALTGKGSASKEQVCAMALHIAGLPANRPKHLDATDALAAAICHSIHSRFDDACANSIKTSKTLLPQKQSRRKSSWSEYLSNHPDRIKKVL